MRRSRRKKNPVLRRLIATLILFVLVFAGLITYAILQPQETVPPSVPPDESTQTATDTTADDPTRETAEPVADGAALKALCDSLFAAETFTAKYLAVYDTVTGQTLFSKNADEKIVAASTIKLLTALTMLDYVDDSALFTVGSEISLVGANSSTAKLRKGYVLTTEQILDALLIPSGNDAAYVIAAHVGRKIAKDPQTSDRTAVELFLEKMNEKAKTLGAVNSLFTCPDGYPNKTQYTTASDMMKISVAAAKNEKIRRTTSKVFVTYTANDGKVLEYTNTNHLIVPSSGNYYEGLFGMKTGTTNAAGQCLIAGCNIYGHEVIITVFKSTDRWADCKKVIDVATSAVEQALKVQP